MKYILLILFLLCFIPSATAYGNGFFTSSAASHTMNDADDATAINFTVHHTGYINQLFFYMAVYGSPIEWQIGIKNTHNGTYVSWENVTLSATGEIIVNLSSNFSVTDGDSIYVAISPSGVGADPDGSNYTKFYTPSPANTVYPYSNETDSNYEVWFHDAAWAKQSAYSPYYIIGYNDSTVEGQPFYSAGQLTIYEGRLAGSNFTAYSDISVTHISGYVAANNVPPDNLTVELQYGNGTLITSSELVNSSTVTGSWVKYTASLSASLINGESYRIFYRSNGSNSTHNYRLGYSLASAGREAITYNGTNANYTYSTDNGSSWNEINVRDVYFVFMEAAGSVDSYDSNITYWNPDSGGLVATIDVTNITAGVSSVYFELNDTNSGWLYSVTYSNGTFVDSDTATYENETLNFSIPLIEDSYNITESLATSSIIIPANSLGMFNNWTVATNFSNIAANESNDVCYSYYNVTTGEWESYYVGYSWNANYGIPKEASVGGFFGSQTTITSQIKTPADTNLSTGWNMIFLMGTDNETIADIIIDIESSL